MLLGGELTEMRPIFCNASLRFIALPAPGAHNHRFKNPHQAVHHAINMEVLFRYPTGYHGVSELV